MSIVRSESRVEDISGQQESCTTVLVRHTPQIWFRSWTQKSPKCKREGAVGVDGERDEFERFLLETEEQTRRVAVRERETEQLEPSPLRGRFSFEAVQERNSLVKSG